MNASWPGTFRYSKVETSTGLLHLLNSALCCLLVFLGLYNLIQSLTSAVGALAHKSASISSWVCIQLSVLCSLSLSGPGFGSTPLINKSDARHWWLNMPSVPTPSMTAIGPVLLSVVMVVAVVWDIVVRGLSCVNPLPWEVMGQGCIRPRIMMITLSSAACCFQGSFSTSPSSPNLGPGYSSTVESDGSEVLRIFVMFHLPMAARYKYIPTGMNHMQSRYIPLEALPEYLYCAGK